jgi:predicted oxidoreductase (fatty acid repression mutant protein)
MANWFTGLENFFTTTEADVVAVIAKIKAAIPVVENDINAVVRWVVNNTPTIAADIQQVERIVTALGFVNPEVSAAIAAANTAVVALNAFAASEKAGQSNVQSAVNGYIAVKQAQASVAQAAVAAAAAPSTASTAAAAVAAAA